MIIQLSSACLKTRIVHQKRDNFNGWVYSLTPQTVMCQSAVQAWKWGVGSGNGLLESVSLLIYLSQEEVLTLSQSSLSSGFRDPLSWACSDAIITGPKGKQSSIWLRSLAKPSMNHQAIVRWNTSKAPLFGQRMLKAQCDVLDALNDAFHINVQIGNPISYKHNWDNWLPLVISWAWHNSDWITSR